MHFDKHIAFVNIASLIKLSCCVILVLYFPKKKIWPCLVNLGIFFKTYSCEVMHCTPNSHGYCIKYPCIMASLDCIQQYSCITFAQYHFVHINESHHHLTNGYILLMALWSMLNSVSDCIFKEKMEGRVLHSCKFHQIRHCKYNS